MPGQPRDRINKSDRQRDVATSRKNFFDQTDLPLDHHKSICQILQFAITSTAQTWPTETAGWNAFPWVTLVLGSGSLGLPTRFLQVADTIPARIVAELNSTEHPRLDLADIRRDAQGDEPEDFLAMFVKSLVLDRLGATTRQRRTVGAVASSDADRLDIDPLATPMALLAAQASRTYYAISMTTSRAPSRWSADVATIGNREPSYDDMARDFIEPLARTLHQVLELIDAELEDAEDGGEEEILSGVKRLLTEIVSGLNNRPTRLASQHVRTLADLSWHYIVRRESSYPGWTDLLLRLLLMEASSAVRLRQTRPRWRTLGQLAGSVEKIILPPTIEAWETGSKPEHSDSGSFYSAAADMLWAQSQATREDTTLPKAVAFVTNFDLELEMALWRGAIDDSAGGNVAFSVVIPVYIAPDKNSAEAEFFWLEGVVEPRKGLSVAAGLESLRGPKEWRVLSEMRGTSLLSHPTVVHLSGCPLIRLPDLIGANAPPQLIADLKGLQMEVGPQSHLAHSITVDEYLALRQSEAEHYWAYRATDPQSDIKLARSLPDMLLKAEGEPGPLRFWMAMGVALMDPAVRLRVISQITARRFARQDHDLDAESAALLGISVSDAPTARNEIYGMAVNLRIDDDESALLQSLGFDVVEDRVQSFTRDLEHYTLHLREAGQGKRPPLSAPCQLERPAGKVAL